MPASARNSYQDLLDALFKLSSKVARENILYGKEISDCDINKLSSLFATSAILYGGAITLNQSILDCIYSKFNLHAFSAGDVQTPIVPVEPPCCGITAWNYISQFNLTNESITSIVPTATPGEYEVTISNLLVDIESSSELVQQGLVVTLGEEIFNHIESVPLPSDITIIAKEDAIGLYIVIPYLVYSLNQDGMQSISVGYIYIDLSVEPTAEVFKMGITTFNDSCQTPSFGVTENTVDDFQYGVVNINGVTLSTYNLSVFSSVGFQAAIAIQTESGDEPIFPVSIVSSYFANCDNEILQSIELDFDCNDDEISLSYYSIGLSYTDTLFIECSSDGSSWTSFYTPPNQNYYSFLLFEQFADWNPLLFPEGEIVHIRMRSTEKGILFTDTVLVPFCGCTGEFTEGNQEFNCDTGTGILSWRSCWSWVDLAADNSIVMEWQTSPTTEPTVWTEISNLGPLAIDDSLCFDFSIPGDLDVVGSILVRFRDTVNDCTYGNFAIEIPPCNAEELTLSFDTSINTQASFTITGTANINWGDGSPLETGATGAVSHNYGSIGIFVVTLYGNSIVELKDFVNDNLYAIQSPGSHSLLTYIDIDSDAISSVSLNSLTNLLTLNISTAGGLLPTVNTAGLSTLEALRITGVPFGTYLDFSSTPNLTTLWLKNCSLTNVDVQGLTDLFQLDLSNNQLTAVDLTSNLSLNNATFSNNLMTVVSMPPSIQSLNIESNQFTIPPVWQSSLTYLNCQSNFISIIDLSTMPNLVTLICGNNLVSTLDLSQTPNLGHLNITGCPFLIIDLSTLLLLQTIRCGNCLLSAIDISQSTVDYVRIEFHGNGIGVADVNAALNVAASQGNLNGIFSCENQAPAAPPSGAGIVDKNTLIANGWTVTTD